METEEWKIVPSWPDYEASSLGRVRRTKAHARPAYYIQKLRMVGHYLNATVYRDKVPTKLPVHRLVCEAFHGPCPSDKKLVAHANGDPLDNRPSNLRWATYAENRADDRRHGKLEFGDAHWSRRARAAGERPAYCARLTPDDVRRIRSSNKSYRQWGRELGVRATTVRAAKLGLTWKDIEPNS